LLSEGNRKAGQAAVAFATPQLFHQARLSHQFLQKNRRTLQKQFQLTVDHAHDIILTCPDCQAITPLPQIGTNPHGTASLQLWRTDVTHVHEFGRLKYVHVTIDTFSSYMFATAH
ncbi:POK25 protein, partial [Odontophorus gujanensis]|nr:POK25 protein [Odontophorus gujanensis]